ncbi:winged helix DNA-binding domain-containing protein [soil metagenome]
MTLTGEAVRRLRVGAQQLHRPEPGIPVGELVRRLCGVQAQALSAQQGGRGGVGAEPALALRARAAGLTRGQVDGARLSERSVVWTWAMRGTLHLVATDDLGWLLPLVAPARLPAARRRLRELGVGGDDPARAVHLIARMLADEGPLTRAGIAERLARHGIPTQGQAAAHLMWLAAMNGVACHGPESGGEPAFVLVRDWVGPRPALPRQPALAELARRYLGAYGPAEPRDLAAWSGLTVTDARAGWRQLGGELAEVTVNGDTAWTLRSGRASQAPPGVVRLVPSFDTYLLGYRSRELAVAPRDARKVHPGGGWLHPVLLVDGRAAGTWNARQRRGALVVTVQPFAELGPPVRDAVRAEADDVARFHGLPGELVLA